MYKKYLNRRILIVAIVTAIVPFIVFFCYNLGKYSGFRETLQGTSEQYFPLIPVCVVVIALAAGPVLNKEE